MGFKFKQAWFKSWFCLLLSLLQFFVADSLIYKIETQRVFL